MRFIAVLAMFCFVVGLTGCATTSKQKDLEVQGLKNQINTLEARVAEKDEEISNLREALAKLNTSESSAGEASAVQKTIVEKPSIKQIQIALKNAGFNPGNADGRMGKQTRMAIREFQKAHNLHVDGKVGNKTWDILGQYLDKAENIK